MKGVYFDITTRMLGISEATAKIVTDAAKAGEQSGKSFSETFMRQTGGATAAMERQVQAATATLEGASVRVVKAKDSEADASGRVRVAESALNDARGKYAEDSTRYIRAEEALEKAKRGVASASADVAAANKVEADAQDALTAKHTEAAAAGSAATRVNAAGAIAAGGVAAAMGMAIKAAGDYQQSQEKLVTTAGLAPEALGRVTSGIEAMSGQVGYSAQDLSEAMYTVSSGMEHTKDPAQDAANALMILKAGAQGAAQEQAPLKDVVDATTTALKDYNLPASSAADVTSKMITAVSHGKATFGEFTSALGQVQAGAAAAHVPMSDLYADLAQMTVHGIPAEQAAQNLNRAITTLQKPSADMTTSLANIGINAADLSDKLGSKGVSGTMEDISVAIMQHMGPAGRVLIDTFNQSKTAAEDTARVYDGLPPKLQAIADQVKAGVIKPSIGALEGAGLDLKEAHQVAQFAQAYEKTTGVNATLTSLKNSDKTYQQMLLATMGNQETARVATNLTGDTNFADVTNTRGAIDAAKADPAGNVKGWTEVQGNFNQKLRETEQSIKSTAIVVGTDLLPVATKMVGWLQDASGWLSKNKTVTDGLIITVGGLGAAWLGWKVVSGTMSLVKSGIDGIGTAMDVIKGTPAAIGKGFSAISDGASAAARIAGDAGAYVSLRVEAIKNFAMTKGAAIADATETAAAWTAQQAKVAAGWVATQAKAVASFVATKAGAIESAGETAAAWVASNLKAAASFAITEGAAIAESVATAAVTAATWLWDLAMDANPIGAVILGVTALIAGIVLLVKHWDLVTKAWDWTYKHVLTPVGHWFQHVWNDDIVPAFHTATSAVSGFFKSMGDDVRGVWVDVVHIVGWAVDKMAYLFDTLPSKIHIPGTNFDTPDFKQWGRDMHAWASQASDYKAEGGLFRGKGGPREDANLVAVSDGEYWVNADATAKNLPLLNAINSGKPVSYRLQDGGLVGDPAAIDVTGTDYMGADPSQVQDAYTTGVTSTPKPVSGLEIALKQIRDHVMTMYAWGGTDLATGVDCSGLVGDAELLATGQQPDHRVGTTETLLGGGWPHMISGATRDDLFIVGVNPDHMVAKVLGEGIEARDKGEHIRMGSDAADPFSSQFTAQFHLDPNAISPPYNPAAGADPVAPYTLGSSSSDRAARYRDAAQRALEEAKKHDEQAQRYLAEAATAQGDAPGKKNKHLLAAQHDLALAAHAEALAARSTGDAKQRHLDAAQRYRDAAQKAQDAAGKVSNSGQKYLDLAQRAKEAAQKDRDRAAEDMAKAEKAALSPGKHGRGSSSSTGAPTSIHELGERLGGLGADFLTETFLPSFVHTDLASYPLLKVGANLAEQLPNVKFDRQPTLDPFAPPKPRTAQELSDLLPPTHDFGGPVPPGLSWVNNKTGHDEHIVNPELTRQQVPRLRNRTPHREGPAVYINQWIARGSDRAEANALGRAVRSYEGVMAGR